MDSEDFGFELSPEVEELEMEDLSDVGDLMEAGAIGKPEEYGFESAEELFVHLQNFVAAPHAYELLQEGLEEKWEEFSDRYAEDGGILYNPEKSDEYYTDDPDLLE